MTNRIPALSKGFYTTESAAGRGCIKISFESLAELHAADDELRALLTAPVVERQPDECTSCDGSGEYIDAIGDWRGYCSCPVGVALKNKTAPVAVAHPFADKVIRKLQRFQECADDNQGADIGRQWFDLLTQLGLLNRVQRSPALWEITQQGEDVLDTVKEMNQ